MATHIIKATHIIEAAHAIGAHPANTVYHLQHLKQATMEIGKQVILWSLSKYGSGSSGDNGILDFERWTTLTEKFGLEGSLEMTLDRLATFSKMEIKEGYKLTMMECLIVYENLCKAAKAMGFRLKKD